MAPSDEVTVLVDRPRWDRQRSPYAGRREYSRDAVSWRSVRTADRGRAL